jgi:thiol-disulfide isomerase/thioredoxin
MGKAFWLLVVTVLFALVIKSAHAEIEIGKAAPALSVKEFDGTDFDIKALRGKVIVMNFWATWCGPCRTEMPELSAFNRNYSGQGVAVIGLSVDTRHRKGEAIEVAKAFRVPAAMLDDTKTSGFDVPPYIPVTYVIDKKGIVVARLIPNEKPLTEETLGDIVKPLLEEDDKPAAPAAAPAAAKPADDAKSGGETQQ